MELLDRYPEPFLVHVPPPLNIAHVGPCLAEITVYFAVFVCFEPRHAWLGDAWRLLDLTDPVQVRCVRSDLQSSFAPS